MSPATTAAPVSLEDWPGHNQHLLASRSVSAHFSRKRLFCSTSITGKAIFFQALGRALRMGVDVAPLRNRLDVQNSASGLKLRWHSAKAMIAGARPTALGTSLLLGRWHGAQPSQFAGGPTHVGPSSPGRCLRWSRAFWYTRTASSNMSCHGASMSHCPHRNLLSNLSLVRVPPLRNCGRKRCMPIELAGHD